MKRNSIDTQNKVDVRRLCFWIEMVEDKQMIMHNTSFSKQAMTITVYLYFNGGSLNGFVYPEGPEHL